MHRVGVLDSWAHVVGNLFTTQLLFVGKCVHFDEARLEALDEARESAEKDAARGLDWSAHGKSPEWHAFASKVRDAGKTWAPYIRLREASPSDFDVIDTHRKGSITFPQFCAWIQSAEQAAGTPIGHELSDNPHTPGLPPAPLVEVSTPRRMAEPDLTLPMGTRASFHDDGYGDDHERYRSPRPSSPPRAAWSVPESRNGHGYNTATPGTHAPYNDYDHDDGMYPHSSAAFGSGGRRRARTSHRGDGLNGTRGTRLDMRSARRDLQRILDY